MYLKAKKNIIKNTAERALASGAITKKMGNGFIKQVPRAMYHLLNGGYKVAIESEDDVAVYDSSGKIIKIEQLKHKTSDNILSNTSDDLWGTLYNWIRNYVEETNKSKYADTCSFVIFLKNKNYVF